MDSLIEKVNLSKAQKEDALYRVKNFSKNALRILGFAYKKLDYIPKDIKELEKEENDLSFAGILGIIDPPRESVKKRQPSEYIEELYRVQNNDDMTESQAKIMNEILEGLQ